MQTAQFRLLMKENTYRSKSVINPLSSLSYLFSRLSVQEKGLLRWITRFDIHGKSSESIILVKDYDR